MSLVHTHHDRRDDLTHTSETVNHSNTQDIAHRPKNPRRKTKHMHNIEK